ncbi:cd63 antigen [Dermatophagoides pteronyssinus]|uniref:Cd63 antigen n=1 Tax=Dermatophagoides pteronyssinus TaxID=6956 RepID=A0ABQ8JL83_DERPT|nr:cd63 antigen [Dermatophagoides pteronyssinus]
MSTSGSLSRNSRQSRSLSGTSVGTTVYVRESLMASCSGALVKLALVLFNLILFCIGIFLAYTGYSIFDNKNQEWDAVINTNFKTGSIILIIFGVLIAFVAATGAFGACLENSSLLDAYGYIIFFLVIGEIVLFYFSFKYKDELVANLETGIKQAISRFDKDPRLSYGLQMIQKFFRCCGFEGPDDFGTTELPASCCDQMSKVTLDDPTASCPKDQIHFTNGCKHSPFIEKTLGSVTYASYALVLFQLVILALIIFVLWHAAFYDNLNDLDRQTIEFWFTDLNNLPNKYIDQYLKEYRFSTRKIKIFDSWIITNVLLSLMIFITGMIAMCFRSHNNSRNAMKIYRWIVIPLLLIFIISLFVFTYFLFKYWILFASGSAIKFIYENYNNNQHYYRWLMVYVHHTNQWLNCCDWYYLLEEYEQNNQSNQNFGHTNDSIPLSCCKQLKQYDHSLHSVGYFFNHQFNLTIINNKNYNYNDTLLKGTDFDSWCATKRILSTFERQCALSPIIVIMIILLIIIQSIVIIDISRLISISFYL